MALNLLRFPAAVRAVRGQHRQFHHSPVLRSLMISTHRESGHNNKETAFDFSVENQAKIKEILSRYPSNYKASATIPLLDLAQRQNNNWIPLAAMNKIAEIVEVAPIRVYETCSFYSMFNREPVGKFLLQVCGTTPCQLCNAEKIIHTIEHHLHIHKGETSQDGMFTLMEVECLGACVNAPMMQVNDDFFVRSFGTFCGCAWTAFDVAQLASDEDLTPETTIKLLDDLKAGRDVKIGPQNHRKNSIGPMGATSLLEPPSGPFSRDFDALKKAAASPPKL